MIKIFAILCYVLSAIGAIPSPQIRWEANAAADSARLDEPSLTLLERPADPKRLAEKAGYTAETHEVITEDRYVLHMQRITGSKKSPAGPRKAAVLLFHGLLDCAASWVLTGPEKSLAMILADRGYDVWLGNARGNRYSRGHLDLAVSKPAYWEFSWHEIGLRDIPAMIDYILRKTGEKKIFYIGHSQGGTSFFAMASERPEYQKKLAAAFALAPATFMSRTSHPLIKMLAPLSDNIKAIADLIGMYELKPTNELIHKLAKQVCGDEAILETVCQNIFFLADGPAPKDMNMTLIPEISQYDPAGSSTRQFVHYAQLVNSGKFRQYDHGLAGNLKKYGSVHPPEYKLADIKMPVYLYYSANDVMVNTKDLQELHEALPNAQKFLVPYTYFSHLDFLFGKHANTWVYNNIASLMAKHKY